MNRSRLAAFLGVALFGSFVVASFQADEAQRLLSEGRELLASQKPSEALAVLSRVAGDVVKDETAKEAAVLRVLAAVRMKDAADAAKRAVELLAAWPADEPWRGRVEGLLATAAEMVGDVKTAAERERLFAERVQADPEKARLAGVYFAWGELLGKGEPAPDAVRPAVPPNPAAAIAAYRRGLEVLGPGADRAPYLLAVARHALALNDGAQAIAAADEALKAWKAPGPNEPGKKPDVTPAWVVEAHLRRAEGAMKHNDLETARGALRTLLALPSVEESPFLAAAWIALGRTYLGDAATGALTEAKQAFATALKLRPDGPEAAAVRRLAAEACLAVGAFDQALPALAAVIESPSVPPEDAAWARFRKAEALRMLRRFDEARAALHEFLAQHPAHPDVPSAQALLPTLILEKAAAALEEGRREDALKAYREFVDAHPLDGRAPQVSLEIGNELRKAKDFDRARDAYREARERWRTARPDAAALAGLAVGVIEEEDRRDLEAAAKAYKDVADAFGAQPAAAQARARLAQLEAIELALSAPRIFGVHEPADLELAVRNVKETTLRLYRLDAAGYFERKATLRGAENLDVALVKADQTWRHATPEFARYRADKLKISLKLGESPLGEGAYLVAAEAEQRRAVVLVLVSKIRLVVKQAPTEIFTWALDAATGAPQAGVEVLIRANGLKTSVKTGEDGVARLAVKPENGACEVMGRLGASAVPGLAQPPGQRTTEMLTPRAHWTFDRPVYRPGEDVRYALVVRDVDQGAFVTPDGAEVEVAWIDPRGRSFATESAKTEAFGRIDGVFQLPPDGALGEWTLRAVLRPHTDQARVFEGRVTVREFRKPELKVSVKATKAVVRPGERVEAKLSIESYFGGAAPRADFRWRAYRRAATFDATRYRDVSWFYKAAEKMAEARPDATWEYVAEGAGTADEKGLATFFFDTQNLVAPQQYLVQASVMDASKQWTTGTGFAFASWTPGNAVVLPDRRAYRAGDRITARVLAVDWNGAPLAVRGKLEVLLKRRDGGKVVEEPTASATVDLGLAGEAEVKIDAPRAGRVIVRFTGEDAAGLKVTGEAEADVAGERPDLAKETKIVFEKEVYRAGDKARLFIDAPHAPATGLLTFEGETVLLHRVVRVTEKSSVVEVDLPELLAPNVVATWSVPHRNELLTSEDPVTVLRHLDVEVKASIDVARPGDKIKLTVTVKDQAGKPVSAAVALAMTDSALQGMGGVGVQDPRFVFNRDVRPHLVRTGSSFAFRQEAVARALDADLVALADQELRMKNSRAVEDLARLTVADSLDRQEKANVAGDPSAKPGQAFAGGAGGGGAHGRAAGGAKGTRDARRAPSKDESDRRAGTPPKADKKAAEGLEDMAELRADFETAVDGVVVNPGGFDDFAIKTLVAGTEARKRVLEGGGYRQVFALTEIPLAGGGAPELNAPSTPQETFGFAAALGAVFTPAPVELREKLADVAAWAPRIVTDANGRAEIEVMLPDNLTVWSADAAAINTGTAGGLGAAAVRVRKDVLVRVSLPAYLSTGDETTAIVLGQHVGEETVRMKLTLRAEGGRAAVVEGASEVEREAGPRGGASFDVRVKAVGAGLATFEGTAATEKAGDGVKQGVRVLPFGEPWRFAERRTLRERASLSFEIPALVAPGATQGRVIVQSGLAAEILEGLAFLAGYPYPALEAVLNRTVAPAVVHRAFVDASLPSPVREEDLKKAVRRLWTTLRGFQNADDAGFAPWPGRPSEPESTAFALDALVKLREAGFVADGDLWNSAVGGALNLLRQGRVTRDQRAALVASLTLASVDVNAELNALFREREGLATASLARLLRAATVAGRGALRGDLLEALRARRKPGDDALPFTGLARDPWLGDDQETTALVLLAYQAAEARPDEQASLVRALRRHWTARGCVHTRATAATALALARHVRGDGALATAGEVSVTLDGKALPAVKIDGATPRAVVELDPAGLGPGRHEVVVTRVGGGELDFRVVASSALPADAVEAAPGFFTVGRRVVPYVDPDRPETKFAEGWSIVEQAKRPTYEPPPPLAQAVTGSRATVRLAIKARDDAHSVVVEDPLPAGFDVVEAGVRGAFARFERRAERMVFFFDRLSKGQEVAITYPVYAVSPGRYRALPAEASEMYAPELRGRSASSSFEIVEDVARLARVTPPKPTPDARLAGARDAFRREDYERVLALAGGLAAEFALTDDANDESLILVQRAALRLGRHAEAVKARDALLLRNPKQGALPTDDLLRLGASYLAVGDAERAREQFQYVADRAFDVETGAADFLESLGRLEDAIARRAEAARRYPARGGVPELELAVAGGRLALRDPAVANETARPLQRMRWADALVDYQRVAAWYPGGELAERAGIERIRVFVGLGLPAKTETEARTFVERFPRAPALDEALAVEAEAAFALGRYADAKAPATAVRTRLFPAHRGESKPSRRSAHFESMAYLLGKIAHVEGRLEEAVRLYGEASSRVPEAAESHRFFMEKELASDPVIRVLPGPDAKLPLRVKNVAKVAVQLYPVDLGVLFATRKSFSELNRADLAGIAPALAFDLETGAKPYVPATVLAQLAGSRGAASGPAALATGAYLAVATDGERTTSSVVLATDLELVVQSGGDGALRCYLTDAKGLPVPKARVTVGQDGAVWYAGETDERGMLLARLRSGGKATVVAEAGDRYAAAEK
jgi:uncharacterized protein YfaS (alpha-2-macroglobulin family)/TolA-binding protein